MFIGTECRFRTFGFLFAILFCLYVIQFPKVFSASIARASYTLVCADVLIVQ